MDPLNMSAFRVTPVRGPSLHRGWEGGSGPNNKNPPPQGSDPADPFRFPTSSPLDLKEIQAL